MRRAVVPILVVLAIVLVSLAATWRARVDLPPVGQREPVAGLTGTEWRFAAIEADGERWEVPADLAGTLNFGDGDGRVRGRTCNGWEASVDISTSTLHVGEFSSTAAACGHDRVETAANMVLQGEVAWMSSGDVLRLTRSGIMLELRAGGR